ncbi:MAG: NAD(P)-dependent oxidoreductase [Bryobacterales bacterium]|nr:NAD(P)-dependent oxidoreductase [Bryobacterales bacterium]
MQPANPDGPPYPAWIHTEDQLEDALSLPFPVDVEAAATLQGDLMLLGAGGKMGLTLARLARRAADLAGVPRRVIAVSRFSEDGVAERFQAGGIEVLRADLLKRGALAALPDIPNIVHMAARKFGTAASAADTWAMNAYLPGMVAERFAASRIVAFSTGNVYPLSPLESGGPTEEMPLAPVGEYGASALARERIFTYFSQRNGTPMALLRLNYAIDLRYGVLVDLATKIARGEAVDVSMAAVNVLWQRDANAACLRALADCSTPPFVLNLTGPETLSVRWLATELGERLGVAPIFRGEAQPTALLNNASRFCQRYGYPTVSPGQLLDWVAHWVKQGGVTWAKPTKFQVRDGKF